jgi:hypothetical protein
MPSRVKNRSATVFIIYKSHCECYTMAMAAQSINTWLVTLHFNPAQVETISNNFTEAGYNVVPDLLRYYNDFEDGLARRKSLTEMVEGLPKQNTLLGKLEKGLNGKTIPGPGRRSRDASVTVAFFETGWQFEWHRWEVAGVSNERIEVAGV